MQKLNQQCAVSYSRVLTEEQVLSLTAQQEECKQFLHSKGFNKIVSFSDIGSANDIEREGLQKMIKFCEDKQNSVKYIAITRTDRLFRSFADFLALEKELDKYGIKIVVTTEQYSSNPNLNLQHNILGAFAQYQSELKSERTINGMKKACLSGKWLWRAPYGYITDKNIRNIVPDKEKSKIVKIIFEKFLHGFIETEISKYLRSQNIVMKPSCIHKILTNTVYCGYIFKPNWSDDFIQGSFEPIVSKEVFFAAQDIIMYVNTLK